MEHRSGQSTSSRDSESTANGDELTRSVAGEIIEQQGASSSRNTPTARNEIIAVAAYYRAQQRGFEPGHDLEDWYEAEREVSEREGAGAIG